MSLIIKGMEMPQAGDVIICGQIEGKLQCTIVTRDKPTKWCEVSELPTPHGRLIDANELMETRLEPNHYEELKDGYIPDFELDLAPTIIEAEVNE